MGLEVHICLEGSHSVRHSTHQIGQTQIDQKDLNMTGKYFLVLEDRADREDLEDQAR